MPVATYLVGAALGIGLLLLGLHQRRKLMASMNWPQTMGTVTKAAISVTEGGDAEDGYTISYSPEVQYYYVVNGQAFYGTCIAHVGRSYANQAQAQAALARYPVNSPVAVYFDPMKPSDAVLVRAAPGSNFLVWAGAIIVALVVAALLKDILPA